MMRNLVKALALSAALGLIAHPGTAGVKDELAQTATAVAPFKDPRAARRAGWRAFGGDAPLMGQHHVNRRVPDLTDPAAFDPARPSVLMYTDIGGRKTLVGVAYSIRIAEGAPLPQGFTGGSDIWHVHNIDDIVAATAEVRPFLARLAQGVATQGGGNPRIAMLHVWTIPNPDGPFANFNRTLPYLKLGLPAAFANGASNQAALGLSLATPQGCARAIDGKAFLAGISRAKKRNLHTACAQAVAYLQPYLSSDKATLNAAAERAWAHYSDYNYLALTPAEHARLAAIVETTPGLELRDGLLCAAN